MGRHTEEHWSHDLPDDLKHLSGLNLDQPIDANAADALESSSGSSGTGGSSTAHRPGPPRVELLAPPYRDTPGYKGHGGPPYCPPQPLAASILASSAPAPAPPVAVGRPPRARTGQVQGVQGVVETSASATAGSSAAAAAPTLPYMRWNKRISGSSYDCDEADHAFLAGLHALSLPSPSASSSTPGKRAAGTGQGHAPALEEQLQALITRCSTETASPTSTPAQCLSSPFLSLTPPVLEAVVEALEQRSYAGTGLALAQALEAEAAQAGASARAHAASLLSSPSEGGSGGAGDSGRGAGSGRSGLSSMATVADAGSVGDAGMAALSEAAATFFVPIEEGCSIVQAILVASCPGLPPALLPALAHTLYGWWLARRGQEVELSRLVRPDTTASSSSSSSSSAGPSPVRSIEGVHRGYLLRSFQALTRTDVPSTLDLPLSLIAHLVLGTGTQEGIQTMVQQVLAGIHEEEGEEEEEVEGGVGGAEPSPTPMAGKAGKKRSRASAEQEEEEDKGSEEEEEEGEGEAEGEGSPGKKKQQRGRPGRKPGMSIEGRSVRMIKADLDASARAILRARLLRAYLERTRTVLDLVRRREKLKRGRIEAMAAYMTALGEMGHSSPTATAQLLPTGADVFQWAEQAAWGPPGSEESKVDPATLPPGARRGAQAQAEAEGAVRGRGRGRGRPPGAGRGSGKAGRPPAAGEGAGEAIGSSKHRGRGRPRGAGTGRPPGRPRKNPLPAPAQPASDAADDEAEGQ